MKRGFITPTDPKKRGHAILREPHREAWGCVRRQKARENVSKSLYCGSHGKGMVREGKQV